MSRILGSIFSVLLLLDGTIARAEAAANYFGLHINPMSYFYHAVNLGADLVVLPHTTVGVFFDYYHGNSIEVGDSNTYGAGIESTVFLTNRPFENSFIVRPAYYILYVRPYGTTQTFTIAQAAGLTAGHHWRITPSGFNATIATGAAVRQNLNSTTKDWRMQAVLECQLGWSF